MDGCTYGKRVLKYLNKRLLSVLVVSGMIMPFLYLSTLAGDEAVYVVHTSAIEGTSNQTDNVNDSMLIERETRRVDGEVEGYEDVTSTEVSTGSTGVAEATTYPMSIVSGAGESADEMRQFSSVMPWLNRSDGVLETYLLSAFYDDRWSVDNGSVVSTLIFMRGGPGVMSNRQLYAFVLCADENVNEQQVYSVNITEFKLAMFPGSKTFSDVVYTRVVFPLRATRCRRPERLSLGYFAKSINEMTEVNSVLVEYPSRRLQHEFTICVPPIFGCLSGERVIEWMEMQRLLGVSKIVIHNNTQCEETSRVFEHYAREGLVDIRQDRTLLPCAEMDYAEFNMIREELFLRDPLMLTDCMYRHMYDSRYILFIDIDEVMVPTKSLTLREMIQDVGDELKLEDVKVGQMTFMNFFFLLDNMVTDEAADLRLPNSTLFLRYRKRLGPSPENKRRKSIVLPPACEFVNNHVCQLVGKLMNDAPVYGHVYVPDTIGKVHHYRNNPCRITEAEHKLRCKGYTPPSPVIVDDEMLKYENKLLPNIEKRLASLE